MKKMEWKYVHPLKMGTEVDVLEVKYHYALPADLKECIKKNNAGMPEKAKFDAMGKTNMIFGGLLSYNEEDADSVYAYISLFEQDTNELKMFPFGLDPFGNFYCIKDAKIVFYDSETENATVIANSFAEFLSILHD